MQRTTFLPDALSPSPRPCENEIFVKQPQLSHHERPLGDETIG